MISDLDLVIEPGQKVLLAGPSGCGKSTVLRALAGALGEAIPGEAIGEVHVDGRVGLLVQNPADSIVADRLGRDVAFGPENLGRSRGEIWSEVRAALAAVGLTYPLDRPTSALSGGELQRLALAGVLAVRPGLLLLDEPTAMLDKPNAEVVRRAILGVAEQTGATVIVVEHRIEPWLAAMDRVLTMGPGGVLVADDDPADFENGQRDQLARSGVWMPGLPAPVPHPVPAELVIPSIATPHLAARELSINLRTRTLRGAIVTPALRQVDASLPPGALTVATGASGAGKSTLVAAFAGLLKPTVGVIAGTPIPLDRMKSPELARLVGWVPQNPEHGFVTGTVVDEISRTANRVGATVEVEALLDLFGLETLSSANPYRLSGGEQRRLALAAALAHRPSILMLDEPTVGQDRTTWAAVAGWIRAAAGSGAAVGVATHDADLVDLAEHHLTLRTGQIVAVG